MKRRTESRRIATTALPAQMLALLFLLLIQACNTASAKTTIIGVDLGMPKESLDISKKLLTSVLTQATNDENFGLVIADELVRNVIEPQPAASLLATMTELQLDSSDSGNFSALLERSLAMADGSTDDTTRLWIISGGSINLGGNADNSARQERFQMWASDILLPDIATRYPTFRLITPELNNEVIVEAVRNYIGSTGQQLLPASNEAVDQFVSALRTDEVIVATSPSAMETPSTTADTTKDAERIELPSTINTEDRTNKDVAAATVSTDAKTRVKRTTNQATVSTQQSETLFTDETTIVAISVADETTSAEPGTTTDAEVTLPSRPEPLKDTSPISTQTNHAQKVESEPTKQIVETFPENSDSIANANTDMINSESGKQQVVDETTTATAIVAANMEVENSAVPMEDSDRTKSTPSLTLVVLGALSLVVLVLIALFRNKRNRSKGQTESVSLKNAHTNAPNVATELANTTGSLEQPPTTKPNTSLPTVLQTRSMHEQSETIAAKSPAISTDDATIVTQPSATEATAVNNPTPQDQKYPSPAEKAEEDFSAFDRSIIEKRWAKMNDEFPSPSDEK